MHYFVVFVVFLQERLVTVVLGTLRQHKYEFIDIYKEEASTALKAVVKQVLIYRYTFLYHCCMHTATEHSVFHLM